MDTDTEIAKSLLQDDLDKRKRVYFWVLFTLGAINNTGYVLVNSSAQSLATKFDALSFMGFFQFFLIFFGMFVKLINSRYLLKMRHIVKIAIVIGLQLSAYIVIGCSTTATEKWGFYLAIFGAMLMGMASSLGEVTIVGFLKGFQPEIISGWGSGTGFAGVFGAGYNLILRFLKLSDFIIFIAVLPLSFVYFLFFNWLKNRMNEISSNSETPEKTDSKEADVNKLISLTNFKRLWRSLIYFSFNLGAVYYLEYTCTTGFANRSTDIYSKSENSIEKNSFVVLQLCYQIGVLISRSSLECIKIKKVWIITLIQAVNFVIWIIFASTQAFSLPIQFAVMILVGLMGGASYVNIVYLLLGSTEIDKSDKEVSLNLISIGNDIGVTMASVTSIILATTVFKKNE